jgi:2-oxoglutarate ferredoxin oxidoreductase subunit alpha
MTSGDEHSERGFITESSVVRQQQMDKRMCKQELARTDDMRPPERYGAEDAEITLVGWGSTKGVIREAIDLLNVLGTRADSLHFVDLWPVPDSAKEALEASNRLIAVEQNYVGQLSNVLRSATGIDMDQRILKYDGKQIGPDDILASIEAEVEAGV